MVLYRSIVLRLSFWYFLLCINDYFRKKHRDNIYKTNTYCQFKLTQRLYIHLKSLIIHLSFENNLDI